MPEPGSVAARSTLANTPFAEAFARGSSPTSSPTEVASELRELTSAINARSPSQGDSRDMAAQVLASSDALVASLPEGGRTEVVAALAELKQALVTATRDQATAQVFASASGRRQTPADAARRDVKVGAVAMARTGHPGAFARAVVGNLSARDARALGQLGEADLREALALEGIEPMEARDAAVERVEAAIADRFQASIQDRGERALERRAGQLRDAADGFERTPMDSRSARLLGAVLGEETRGEVVRQLELMGVNVGPLRDAIGSGRVDGRGATETLKQLLPGVLRDAAERLDDTAETVGGWDRADRRDAVASEAFPEIAGEVRTRWTPDGIVGQAVNDHLAEARERVEFREDAIKYALIGAAGIAGILTGGALGAAAAAGIGAAAREGREINGAWERQELSSSAATAGVGSTETAEADQRRAVIATMAGVTAAAVDTLFAGLMAEGHHGVVHALEHFAAEGSEEGIKGVVRQFLSERPNLQASLEVGSDLGAAILEFAGALGIDTAKHHVEHAAEGHH
jgi:hypothetical protein